MKKATKKSRILQLHFVFMVSLVVSHDGLAHSIVYQPTIGEANWVASSSIFECELTQEIPQFGEAKFYQRSGEMLTFKMQDFTSQLAKDIVMFSAKPATWNNTVHEKKIGVIDISKKIDANTSMEIITNLLNRMNPTFEGSARYRASQSMVIALSPVKFKNAFKEYQECVHSLLPVNYDQIKETIHYWEMEAVELNAEFMKKLDNIAIYANADENVLSINIDSYTDTAGTMRFNQAISDERAALVSNYLVSKGVSVDKIIAQAHGEDREYLIVDPEKSEEDKNKNRRVVISLVRQNY